MKELVSSLPRALFLIRHFPLYCYSKPLPLQLFRWSLSTALSISPATRPYQPFPAGLREQGLPGYSSVIRPHILSSPPFRHSPSHELITTLFLQHPFVLPSASPSWSCVAQCRGLCLKTLLLLHVQMQLEAACYLEGLSSPRMVVLGQESKIKMYTGSCPKERSFIGACFWSTGILNCEMEAPGGLQSISLPLPFTGPATPLPQLSYSP